MEFDSAYVYDDVKRSIDYVHRSGLMHGTVLADPAKYLVKNVSFFENSLKIVFLFNVKHFLLTAYYAI